jgi:hypothetical protein
MLGEPKNAKNPSVVPRIITFMKKMIFFRELSSFKLWKVVIKRKLVLNKFPF